MRRSGFTMVELIFVIIIIGILSVAAIPKFGDIKDRAKSATEYSALSSLNSAITGAMEFQREDFNNIHVDWHEVDWNSTLTETYNNANAAGKVLNKILKKNDDFEIIAYAEAGEIGANGIYDDIFFIKGKASDATLGASEADKVGSLNGKPDKTDVWIFNASPNFATITHEGNEINVTSGEITLIDLTTGLAITDTFQNSPANAADPGKISVSGVIGAATATDLAIVKAGL